MTCRVLSQDVLSTSSKSTENRGKLGNVSATHGNLVVIWGRISERKGAKIFQKYFGFGIFTIACLLFLTSLFL